MPHYHYFICFDVLFLLVAFLEVVEVVFLLDCVPLIFLLDLKALLYFLTASIMVSSDTGAEIETIKISAGLDSSKLTVSSINIIPPFSKEESSGFSFLFLERVIYL